MGQGEKMDRLLFLSAVKDHIESEADTSSPSTSMEVEDSPAAAAGSHDDESKPLSKSAVVCCKSTELTFRLKMQFVQK